MNKKMIGEKIKSLRLVLRLTQEDFGAELGLSRHQISKYECGTCTPSLDVLEELSRKYGLSIDWFCRSK